MSEIVGPVRRRVSFTSDAIDSKSVDPVSRSAAESVASRKRIAAEVVIPDNDNDSGDNSLVGQHVPTGDADDRRNTVSKGLSQRDGSGESSTGPTPSLDIYGSLCPSMQRRLMRTLSSFQDDFVKSLDEIDGSDDFVYLLNLCGDLEQSLRRFEAERRLIKEHNAEAAIVSAAKARSAVDGKESTMRKWEI
ncbi:hypothetical protein ACLOJK_004359 [Asimina triloba]